MSDIIHNPEIKAAGTPAGTFWTVWNPKRDTPTVAHSSEESATREAERLARANKGEQFFVMQATACRFVDDMHRVPMCAQPTPPAITGFTDGESPF